MNNETDLLLDRKEAAEFCKICERTLDRQSDLPRVRLTARRIMYRQSDLRAWIARKTGGITPTSSEPAFAALRRTIVELIALIPSAPEEASEFVESAVRGIYGAGAALSLPLPEIHLSTEAK